MHPYIHPKVMHKLPERSLCFAQTYPSIPFEIYLKLIDYYESETLLDWDLNLSKEGLIQHYYVGFGSKYKGYLSWQIEFAQPPKGIIEVQTSSIIVTIQLCLIEGNEHFKKIATQLNKQNYNVNMGLLNFNSRILPETSTLLREEIQSQVPLEMESLILDFTYHFDKILTVLNDIYEIKT